MVKCSVQGLEVGLQIIIEKEFEDKDLKYRSKIVGWDEGRYVVISLPYINGLPVAWDFNTSCIVKFVNGGDVFAFKSSFLTKQFSPAPIGFIKFPEMIENVTLRKHKRIQTYIICRIFRAARQVQKQHLQDNPDYLHIIGDQSIESEGYEAILIDLSKGGGLLTLNNPAARFMVEELVEIDFMLPTGDSIHKLAVEIRTVRIEQGKKKVGVCFNQLQNTQLNKINAFFEKLEEETI